MRSMKKMGSVVGLVVAVVALAGASSASAVSITPAGQAFSGTSTGEHVFTINANLKVRCNHATFAGTTANPVSNTTSFTATYGPATGASGAWCRLYVGGVFSNATVTPTGSWSLTALTFNSLTGASTGSVTTSGVTHIVVGGCTIDVPSGTTVPVTGQNVTPTGVQLNASGGGLSFTSTGCSGFGVPASGSTATYAGAVDIAGVSIS